MNYNAPHRHATIELSQAAVVHNLKVIKANAHAKEIMAVLKANAFSHGLPEMAALSVKAGATRFGMAMLDEALALRDLGYTEPIDVLGLTDPTYVRLAAERNITLAFSTKKSLLTAAKQLSGTNLSLKVSLPVDTGLNRIGFKNHDDLVAAIKVVSAEKTLIFQSLWTHFATADTPNVDYVDFQVSEWQRLTYNLPAKPNETHFANTGIATWYPEKINTDIVRLGIGLFGINGSDPTMPMPFELIPVLSLKVEVVNSKPIKAGEAVGYGVTFRAPQDGYLITMPIGHSDGYPFNASGMRVLMADGQVGHIAGGVAMDQSMAFVENPVPVGMMVTLIGSVGDETITMEELADYTQCNIVPLMNDFSPRLQRIIVP
ncbi:alanine racemase [Leuconostoc litchii]|uniref:Alanine racemase n=1 Tax=Leuconostoc litchii TaxID=1981069 RepID=A0A6P2CRR3_9LACO|nr:alanine racemase [Leuconostoc litchii]TYC47491.1 alanine racemase [Leuconostoc litchii]GMA69516.1 alanine racemase [Leuconostoc litchii]